MRFGDFWLALALLVVGVLGFAAMVSLRDKNWGLVGAGFLGAGLTHGVDVYREGLKARVVDLDETRRLLYMVGLAKRAKKHAELIASVANALVNHQLGGSYQVVEDRLLSIVKGKASQEDHRWLCEQVAEINRKTKRHA